LGLRAGEPTLLRRDDEPPRDPSPFDAEHWRGRTVHGQARPLTFEDEVQLDLIGPAGVERSRHGVRSPDRAGEEGFFPGDSVLGPDGGDDQEEGEGNGAGEPDSSRSGRTRSLYRGF